MADLFPSSSIRLNSVVSNGKIEIQETRDSNTLKTCISKAGAQVAIVGSFLIYFEGQLDHIENKGLDD